VKATRHFIHSAFFRDAGDLLMQPRDGRQRNTVPGLPARAGIMGAEMGTSRDEAEAPRNISKRDKMTAFQLIR
jgi:hypothetical protein